MRPSSIAPRPYPREYWADSQSERESLVTAARKALGPATQLVAVSDILKRASDRGAMELYSELKTAQRALDDAKEICVYQESIIRALSATVAHDDVGARNKRPHEAPPPHRRSRPPPHVRARLREQAVVSDANGSARVDLDQPEHEHANYSSPPPVAPHSSPRRRFDDPDTEPVDAASITEEW